MSILPVLQYPDPKLTLKAKSVECFDAALAVTIQNMIETMIHDEGCGLAAIQVDIPLRFFVMDTSEEQNNAICLINPEIIEKEGWIDSEEGCLSLPGLRATVKRYAKITTRYQDQYGESHILVSTGLEAYCIQHEIDHLNGVVFIDRLSHLKRGVMIRKYNKQLDEI